MNDLGVPPVEETSIYQYVWIILIGKFIWNELDEMGGPLQTPLV